MYNFILLGGDTAEQVPAGGNLIFTIGWFAILALVFYFMLIRPQKKQQKQMQAMLST